MAETATIVQSRPLDQDIATAAPAPAGNIPALLDSKADQYGVPRQLVRTVAQMESSFNPKADSGEAQGLMQLSPPTAKRFGVTDPFDPTQSADAGVRLLAELIDQNQGDMRRVLAGYNAGQGAVEKYNGVPPYTETQNYVNKGMRMLATGAPAPAMATTPPQGIPTGLAQDLFTRIARGENVQITPQMFLKLMPGADQTAAAAPAPAPAPEAATIVKSLPLDVTPPQQQSVADLLKNESFLDSVANVIKSPFLTTWHFLSGQFSQEQAQQIRQWQQVMQTGTKEQKDQLARDVVLGNVPLASTAYKATQGNIPGALGDLAGAVTLAALPDVMAKTPEIVKGTVGKTVDIVGGTSPGFREAVGMFSARARNILDFAARAKAARDAFLKSAGTAQTVPPTPGAAAPSAAAPGAPAPEAPAAPAEAPPARVIYTPPPAEGAAAAPEAPMTIDDYSRMVSGGRKFSDLTTEQERQSVQTLYNLQQARQAGAAPAAAPAAPAPTPPETPIPPAPEPVSPDLTAQQIRGRIDTHMQNVRDLAGRTSTPAVQDAITREMAALSELSEHPNLQAPAPAPAAAAPAPAPEAPPAAPAPAQAEAAVQKALKKPPAIATAAATPEVEMPPGKTVAEALFEEMRRSGTLPPETPAAAALPAPTASEMRIEALAKEFATNPHLAGITPEQIAGIGENSAAALMLEKLGRKLGIEGRPAPGEIQKIAERVRELRGGGRRLAR
ncbi:MAG: hypothetical protein C5B60_08910 [Chloroflexi bacterium]|nr:MAG: hypothetical protein C5B60_08910 [Chloroflexota bacterium]